MRLVVSALGLMVRPECIPCSGEDTGAFGRGSGDVRWGVGETRVGSDVSDSILMLGPKCPPCFGEEPVRVFVRDWSFTGRASAGPVRAGGGPVRRVLVRAATD